MTNTKKLPVEQRRNYILVVTFWVPLTGGVSKKGPEKIVAEKIYPPGGIQKYYIWGPPISKLGFLCAAHGVMEPYLPFD